MFRKMATLLFLVLLTTLLTTQNGWSAKRYYIDNIQIRAEILADGSLLIEEARTYRFRGRFRWADYNFPLDKLGRVTDFSINDESGEYYQSSEKSPGTYQMSQDKNEFSVKWYYQAKNEVRTFTLKYRVENAVTIHEDVAEFYYKFLRAKRPKPTGSVEVKLILPQPADTSQVRAWLHSSLNGEYRFENGKLRFWATPLPRNNHFEVRVIFPTHWVSAARKKSGWEQRDQILAEERKWVEASNLLREKARQKQAFRDQHFSTVLQLNVAAAAVGLAIFLLLYRKYGRAHPAPFRQKITSEIPREISPAVANYVYSAQQTGAGAMVATLMDLANRSFLTIEEQQVEKKSIFTTKKKLYNLKLNRDKFQSDKSQLAPFEQNIIDFIFEEVAGGASEIQMEKIRKTRSKVTKWFKEWKKMIKAQWGGQPFYDSSSYKGIVYSVLVSLFVVAAGVLSIIFFGEIGLLATISGVILLGLSFTILRYTKEVKLLRHKLTAFRKYLTKYEFRRDSSKLQANFEKYFVYGVALGIGTKAIKELLTSVPDWQSANYFPWYIGSYGPGSPAGFADAVSSMVSVASTTMGSAAGVGGGASAGGGGGAGGAGGGAG
ncbi:MAG: DUF2207 domain-containing protein [bacterium]